MARVKRAVHAKKKRRATLERAKGYYGNKSRSYRAANEQVMHSLQYAYRDRRARKGEFRRLWIQRINAACRLNGISYSRFIAGLQGRRCRGRPQGPGRPGRQRSGGLRHPGGGRPASAAAAAAAAEPEPDATAPSVAPGAVLRSAPRNPRSRPCGASAGAAGRVSRPGVFVVDGPVLVAEAWPPSVSGEVYGDADAPRRSGDRSVLGGTLGRRRADAGIPVRFLAAGVLDQVTPTPSRRRWSIAAGRPPSRPRSPASVAVGRAGVLVLVGVADPGNAGTLIRTAEAAGVPAVVWSRGRGRPVRAQGGAGLGRLGPAGPGRRVAGRRGRPGRAPGPPGGRTILVGTAAGAAPTDRARRSRRAAHAACWGPRPTGSDRGGRLGGRWAQRSRCRARSSASTWRGRLGRVPSRPPASGASGPTPAAPAGEP